MEPQSVERKLAAILSADVKGYSRLMGEDEVATIHTLTAYREVMATLIEQHRGRVVDSPGDNLLAEFASAVDAVQCAVEIQRELKARNAELPPHRRMEFRIGINVGDVIVEGERLYGDGVNVAARLEGLAEGGGICISGTVYDQIENKLALGYEYLGEQAVKNITKPVRVYRVQMEGVTTSAVSKEKEDSTVGVGQALPAKRRVGTAHLTRAVLVLVGLLVIVGGIAWYLFSPTIRTPHSLIRTQAEQATSLPLPLKPSIAVLPFVNISEDPKQEYFNDGMTDTLITDLSKVSGLFVIARNSAFTYKGKAVKVGDVGKELGVRYVVEGGVLKAGDKVRISAQLIDTTTAYHLWSERYDRELKDLFALQDEITQRILTALRVKLTPEEQERFRRAPTTNLEAYDCFLRGWEYFWRFTREANTQARQMFEQAVALDPQYAAAYAALSATQWVDWLFWDPFRSSLDQIFALAQRAVELDDSLPVAHGVLGYVYLWKKQHAQAIAEAERTLALDPNYAGGHFALTMILNFAGRPEEAIGLVKKAMRLDPAYPAQYLLTLGQAYLLTGRYEEAIATFKRALARNPNLFDAHASLAVSYGELGREEEARAAVAELLKTLPYFSLEVGKLKSPYKDPAIVERQLALLHRAGVKWRWPTDNPEALGALWAGLEHFSRRTKEGKAQARQLFERAIALDPQYAAAHAFLGGTYLMEWASDWSQDPQSLEQAFVLTQKAVALDDSLPLPHAALGHAYLWKKQHGQAIAAVERAISLDPNDPDGYARLAEVLVYAGQPEKALGLVEKAMRLNPQYRDGYSDLSGMAYQVLGRHVCHARRRT